MQQWASFQALVCAHHRAATLLIHQQFSQPLRSRRHHGLHQRSARGAAARVARPAPRPLALLLLAVAEVGCVGLSKLCQAPAGVADPQGCVVGGEVDEAAEGGCKQLVARGAPEAAPAAGVGEEQGRKSAAVGGGRTALGEHPGFKSLAIDQNAEPTLLSWAYSPQAHAWQGRTDFWTRGKGAGQAGSGWGLRRLLVRMRDVPFMKPGPHQE
jgi:hypothetical protein